MKVIKKLGNDGNHYVQWKCPGCKGFHAIPVTGPYAWGFNEDLAKPTLTPSVLERVDGWTDPEDDSFHIEPRRCHFFLRDGRAQFLDDCTHDMKNQTVELPEVQDGQ